MPKKLPSTRPRPRRRPSRSADPLKQMMDRMERVLFDGVEQAMDKLLSQFTLIQPPIPRQSHSAAPPRPRAPHATPPSSPPSSPPPALTLYDALGISPAAPATVITAAYRALSKLYHPDVYKGRDGDQRMKLINQAYGVLGDEEKRKAYDQSLKGSGL